MTKTENIKTTAKNYKEKQKSKIPISISISIIPAVVSVLNFCHLIFGHCLGFRILNFEFCLLFFGHCFETGDPHAVCGVRRTISYFRNSRYVMFIHRSLSSGFCSQTYIAPFPPSPPRMKMRPTGGIRFGGIIGESVRQAGACAERTSLRQACEAARPFFNPGRLRKGTRYEPEAPIGENCGI